MNQITPQLTIASLEDVREGSLDNPDLVVGVCQDSAEDNVGCEYVHTPLRSSPMSNYLRGTCDYDTFCAGVDPVVDALSAGDSVVIHCHKGEHRSVAVAIAALSVAHGWPYEMAAEAVTQAHPDARFDQIMTAFATTYAISNGGRMWGGTDAPVE